MSEQKYLERLREVVRAQAAVGDAIRPNTVSELQEQAARRLAAGRQDLAAVEPPPFFADFHNEVLKTLDGLGARGHHHRDRNSERWEVVLYILGFADEVSPVGAVDSMTVSAPSAGTREQVISSEAATTAWLRALLTGLRYPDPDEIVRRWSGGRRDRL